MRGGMAQDVWNLLFDGLLEVLWEYCANMFDKNEWMVNTAVRNILGKMRENSALAGKGEQALTYNEKELADQVERLEKAVYKSF